MRADRGSDIENLIAELEHLKGWDMFSIQDGDFPCKKDQVVVCLELATKVKELLDEYIMENKVKDEYNYD